MQSRRTLTALAAVLFALPVFAQAPNTNPPPATPEHDPRIPALLHSLAQARSIRETQLSPDGNLIAWTVNGEGIVLAPLSNPTQTRHITACVNGATGHESSLAWSPDSKTLAFFSDCTDNGKADAQKTAIYTDDVTGTAAPHKLAQLNGYAKSLEYSPDGKYLSLLYVEGATRPSGALAAMKPPSGVIGVEGLEVQRIAAVDASTGQLQQITPANLHVYEFSWSKDAKALTFIAAPPPGEDNWWTAKLYTEALVGATTSEGTAKWQSVAGQTPHVVFDPNTTTGQLHGLQIAVPRFSPDGSKIAFIGGLMSDQGIHRRRHLRHPLQRQPGR